MACRKLCEHYKELKEIVDIKTRNIQSKTATAEQMLIINKVLIEENRQLKNDLLRAREALQTKIDFIHSN